MNERMASGSESVGCAAKPRLTPLPFSQVEITDRFWRDRQEAVRTGTLPFLLAQSERFGMVKALAVDEDQGPLPIPIRPQGTSAVMYWDSDWAKWIETASYSLRLHPDPALEAKVDDIIAQIGRAQRADGYFNSYFLGREPDKIWSNLRDWHELYCAGHLIEAAVANCQATGKRALLDIMLRYVEHIRRRFGREAGQERGYCGHEKIELALVRLYRVTGDRRHLELARYFIDERGQQPHYFDIEARRRGDDPAAFWHGTYEYNQSHLPVREQRQVVGHAVRAMYLYSAMADLAGEYGDADLRQACERLWDDLTTKRLYVTGGLGPSAQNEGFTSDYDLPNETAYAETCAAVGLVFWSQRMLGIAGDRRYADMMELALYNGALSGLALTGDRFFYDNPLASRGDHHRWTWHRCICCPANIGRLVASVGGYAYGTGERELAVHLFIAGTAEAEIAGTSVRLRQETDYPWDGRVAFAVELERPTSFALRLRLPAWCPEPRLSLNGAPMDLAGVSERGYAHLDRTWRSGDRVVLELPMLAQRLYASPAIRFDLGRTALRRGPLLFCAEGTDNEVPIERLELPDDATIAAVFRPDLLSGTTVLEADARASVTESSDTLYRTTPPLTEPARLRAIPYHLWDNREPGDMAVWLRRATSPRSRASQS